MDKQWLIILQIDGKNEVFGFPAKKNRSEFLKEIKRLYDKHIQYLLSVEKVKV
jgi:hypothetical protein